MITINLGVHVYSVGDVMLGPLCLTLSPEKLHDSISRAFDLNSDGSLHAACNGAGYLSPVAHLLGITNIDYIEFIKLRDALKSEYDLNKQKIKNKQSKRRKFNSNRKSLFIDMIERGDKYICSTEGCEQNKKLHIDHKKPLSKGGSNELENLQFLCAICNSKKGDRF